MSELCRIIEALIVAFGVAWLASLAIANHRQRKVNKRREKAARGTMETRNGITLH